MKFYINLCFALFFCMGLKAQERSEALSEKNFSETPQNVSDNKLYQKEAIYLKTSFWKGQQYVKNGVSYRCGFMNRNLKKEFANYPVAQAEFMKYQKQFKRKLCLGLAGVGVSLVGLASWINRSNKSNNPDGIPPSDAEAGLYLGGLGLATMAGTWGTISSSNTLQRAIFLRNQAVCEGK